MEKAEKKVLTVDAGGAKGIYSVLVMAGLEQRFGIDFNAGFDYYAGTSIGGVITAALAYGVGPGEILARIASLRADLDKGHIYLLKKIFEWVDHLFGNEPFSKIKPELFLPVYDFSNKELSFFSSEQEWARDIPLADMLKSSCSDLRIVPPYRIDKANRSFVDAGFFAYDPTLFFIRSCRSIGGKTLNLLSIGSGLIENLAEDLNLGDKFDLIYDAFLYEQFQTTAFFFNDGRKGFNEDRQGSTESRQGSTESRQGSTEGREGSVKGRQGDRYKYTRISEFPRQERSPFTLDQIVEMAQNRVKKLQSHDLAAFC